MSPAVKIALIVLIAGVGIIALFFLASFLRTIPCFIAVKDYPPTTTYRGVTTIEDAVKACRKTGLEGWELVEYAQQLVAGKMEYSYCNSWDMPSRAFERGRGYCWQQTGALHKILHSLGIRSRKVHAFKNYFPEEDLVSGHTWLEVTVKGETKDVCPGDRENVPGTINFQVLSEIKEWGPVIAVFSYFGSAWINANRYATLRNK